MIPKIIHYCWFGGKPKPQKVLEYIETWKKFLPDFQIKEWNESNFDVNMMPYTREAYYAKKYAFVSDVARLYALVHEGGIYFDTDIRVVKRFSDELLESHGFLGFEHDVYITTGVMACEPFNNILVKFLKKYTTRHFFRGLKYDTITNVMFLTSFLKSRGLKCNNKYQMFEGLIILPQVYLCANDFLRKKVFATEDTYVIHEFSYSWGNNLTFKRKIYHVFKILSYTIQYRF